MRTVRDIRLETAKCGSAAALLAAALLFITCPALAESTAGQDPCAALSAATANGSPRIRLQIDSDAATSVLKHLQRACVRFALWRAQGTPTLGDRAVAEMQLTLADLRRWVIAPIEAQHPDLAGQDLTQTKPDPTAKPLPDVPKHTGPATARHLAWALWAAEDRILGKTTLDPKPCGPNDHWTCSQARVDVAEQIGFALTSITRDYPALERQRMETLDTRNFLAAKRTHMSDANFRKYAARPGTATLTPAALAYAKEFDKSSRASNRACQVISFSFDLGGQEIGPNDSAPKSLPAGIGIGGYFCRELPPDVVQVVDGLRLLFMNDPTHSFEGKIIDYRDEKFTASPR